jgi:sugar/nucleoside kinase (ribokinase family)
MRPKAGTSLTRVETQMNDKEYDILVAGEINPDLVLSSPNLEPLFDQHETLVDSANLTIGSSCAIFACGAARLGLRVAIIGIVGKDLFGDFMLAELQRRAVDISQVIVDSSCETGLSVILSRGQDRAILTYMGSIDALQARQVTDSLLEKSRHLHVASYFLQTALQPDLPGLFRHAHALGLSTSLDTNWDPAEQWAGVHAMLDLTDIFLPNAAEAQAIAGLPEPGAAALSLAGHAGIVVVKQGSLGALAAKGKTLIQARPLPAKVVDTVGAGDSFDAGFLYGYLNHWSMEKALKLATACGAISTQSAGGTTGQATLDEALHYVN